MHHPYSVSLTCSHIYEKEGAAGSVLQAHHQVALDCSLCSHEDARKAVNMLCDLFAEVLEALLPGPWASSGASEEGNSSEEQWLLPASQEERETRKMSQVCDRTFPLEASRLT